MGTKYKFYDLVNLEKLKTVINSFSNITQIPIRISDIDGRVFISSLSRNVCSKFFNSNTVTNKQCTNSMEEILEKVKNGEKHIVKKCENGLASVTCPIIIENEPVATIRVGEFYFEKPNKEQSIKEAKMYGFSIEEYLDAVDKVAILSKDKVDDVINFVKKFTQVLTEISYSKIKEFESEKKINKAHQELYNLNEQLEKEREEIRFLAYTDIVTGLPNKMYFYKMFNSEFYEKNTEHNEKNGSLIILGLNNFKNINDNMGYEYGDKILKICGSKLKETLKDEAVVFKLDSDKFLVLIKNSKEYYCLRNIIDKTLNIFVHRWSLDSYKVSVTASMGICNFNHENNNVETILKNADIAMYKAKELEKNKYVFYNKSISEKLERKIKIENCLNKALENEELYLCYQPQVNVLNNEVEGFEALLRWNSKELGLVSPGEFIPIAEETGLIIPIGEWVIRTACEQNRKWNECGYKFQNIAVNISAVQLQQPNLVDIIKNILKETGVKTENFEIEITESTMMKSLDLSIKRLQELRAIGVKIALDDFGTGYSSLNYLKMLPVNRIKIDKSFIDDICIGDNEEIIIEGLIFLGHKMNLDIVAEGVELEEQVQVLKDKSCDKIQGYYFSKPLKESEAECILKNGLMNNGKVNI